MDHSLAVHFVYRHPCWEGGPLRGSENPKSSKNHQKMALVQQDLQYMSKCFKYCKQKQLQGENVLAQPHGYLHRGSHALLTR